MARNQHGNVGLPVVALIAVLVADAHTTMAAEDELNAAWYEVQPILASVVF